MALSDDELLDFDETRLDDYDAAKARLALEQHGDAFRYQLIAARWLDAYAQRRAEPSITSDLNDRFEAGAQDTLRDIAAHLRQGDFLPGGTLYDDELKRAGD